MEVVPSDRQIDQIACDALVCAAFSKDGGFDLGESARAVDRALDGYLSEYLQGVGYKAKAGEVITLATHNKLTAREVAVVGVGERDSISVSRARRAAAATARRLSSRSVIASALAGDLGLAEAVVQGYLLATHKGPTYKSKEKDPPKIQRVELMGIDADAIERGSRHARATTFARDLTNEPASVLTPEELARRAADIAEVGGIECTVWDEDEIRERGFGGLAGVGSGSTNPPRLIQLHHPADDAKARVVLIGKGVTFDSGGISLKDARGMETMKTDMGGAAAVLGVMHVLPQLSLPIDVLALIPATENMPSGHALRPGDVIEHYGGRTTEVINTDAEGRLILADAIAFASEQSPDAILDVATLTGAISIALGKKMTGVFCNDDDLWAEISAASEPAGEPMWRLPLVDDYKKSLESDVADAKNVGTRYGGSIVAALFLREFVRKGVPWAHLDIAGTGRAEDPEDDTPRGATGVAARTLLAWLDAKGQNP